MVAEPLVEAGQQGELDGDRHGHGPGHGLDGEAHVQIVHFVVEVVHQGPSVRISFGVGVRGGPPHVDCHLAHPFDQTPAASRQLGTEPRAARRATCSARSPLRSRSGSIRMTVTRYRS